MAASDCLLVKSQCKCMALCVCAEIKAMPDLNLEVDMKLDKLESFLGKLNSKGESCMACCHIHHDHCVNCVSLHVCSVISVWTARSNHYCDGEEGKGSDDP